MLEKTPESDWPLSGDEACDEYIWAAAIDVQNRWERSAKAGYSWEVVRRSPEVRKSASSLFKQPVPDHQTRGVLIALLDAIEALDVDVRTACLFCDVDFISDIINMGIAERRARGYKRKNRRPLAYVDDWQSLDEKLAGRGISLIARRPVGKAQWRLEALKDAARLAVKDRPSDPSEIGL